MSWFQNTWTRRFNARQKLWGHLFGGRYKAKPVEEGEYLSRLTIFEDRAEGERDRRKKRNGIPARRVAKVIASGGRLSEADLSWCQTRYFLDGVAIGVKAFVEMNYEATREYFGGVRRSGARRMRRVSSALCTLRDLQREAVRATGTG